MERKHTLFLKPHIKRKILYNYLFVFNEDGNYRINLIQEKMTK